MKKLEFIIKAEKLELLRELLKDLGVKGLMITNIRGIGNEKGYPQIYRGEKYTVNILPKVRIETVVKDEIYETVVESVLNKLSTGEIGDGKIFIYNVEDAVRIRTGERGENAL